MTAHSPAANGQSLETRTGVRYAAGFTALVLGAFFVFGAGFAQSAAMHDTAHDVRHAFGFPCH